MDQRSQYLIQILEKIGAPLLGAVADVAARQATPGVKDQDDLARQDAQRVAELLARAIQISIDLGKSMDLGSMPDQGESLRLALAALAGDVVAGQYKTLGRVPTDADMRRAVTALEAVLTFSENFIPTPENTARLANVKAQGVSVDAQQTVVQSVQAFVPVVNAIGMFPFGQPEQKLMQDVSERLLSVMYELTQKLFGNSLDETTRPFAELAILRSLAEIYTESHMAEMNRLMRMSEDVRQQQALSMDPVWAAFDTRVAMLEVLSLSLANGNASQGADGSKAPAVSTPQAQAPVTPPPAEPATPAAAPPSIFKSPTASTTPPATPPPAAPPPGGNPMSMFAKPGADAPPPAAPVPPPAPPAAENLPPAPPPAAPPPASPPGGGPMSFFKKPE